MNFIIRRETLLYNLNNASKALSNKVQMPGLTGILFNVKQNEIILTTSNNDISIRCTIDKDFTVQEEGDFVLQGKYLIEIVKKITSDEIEFKSYEGNTIKLLAGKSVFTLNELSLDSFPKISFEESNLHFDIEVINLKQIIRKTSFAISPSESRVVLTGVSLATFDNTLEFVATDSFRLSRKRIIFDKPLPEIKVVIPGKALDELNKILEESEGNIEIHCSSTKVLFKYDNLMFQTRLINGVFPNIESLIPDKYLLSVKFDKEKLLETIDRVSIFVANELSNVIKLSFYPSGIVEFTSNSNEIGGAVEEIVPISYSSNIKIDVALSSKYLLEALRSFDSKEISINFTSEVKPITITGEYDYNLIQLILPLRA